MPFVFDTETYDITMACGDTAFIAVDIDWDKLNPGDVVLFAIFDRSTGKDKLVKTVEIEEGCANIRLCNHDTRDVEAGKYKWNLRIVTSPSFGEDGSVAADECTDEVVTVFNSPPNFKLTRGGARV